VVEFGDGLLVVFREGSQEVDRFDLVATQNENWIVGSIRDWYFRDLEVYALAEIFPPGFSQDAKKWRFALLRFYRSEATDSESAKGELRFSVLWDTEITDQSRDYSLFANSYIAEARGRIFVLIAGNPTRVLRVADDHSDLLALPPPMRKALDVKRRSKSNIGQAYIEIEAELASAEARDYIFPTACLAGMASSIFCIAVQRLLEAKTHLHGSWLDSDLIASWRYSARFRFRLSVLGFCSFLDDRPGLLSSILVSKQIQQERRKFRCQTC
jgi:hypothetical protein